MDTETKSNIRNGLIWIQARYNACCQLLVRLGVKIPPNSIGAVVTDPAIVDKKVRKEKGLLFNMDQVG
jgi:hypothetical protein